MKKFASALALLSLLACHSVPNTAPKPSPNWCPKCEEKHTYEIINLGGPRNGPNRRCMKCGYTWFCTDCWTDPFWRTK